jgi:hypothetical protein
MHKINKHKSAQLLLFFICILIIFITKIYIDTLHKGDSIFQIPKNIIERQENSLSNGCMELWNDKLTRRERRLKERAEFLYKSPWKNEKNAYDPFEPDWDCEVSDRVGIPSVVDGAKYVCGVELLNKSSCLVYGIGGGDFIFEKKIREFGKNCEIHSFDISFNPEQSSITNQLNINYHKIGIGSGMIKNHNGETITLRPILDIIKELGHQGHKIDICKIDCEGCEYQILPPIFEMIGSGQLDIGQILVEIHGTDHAEIVKLFQHATNAKNIFIFHKERNHEGCDGYRCIEFGFISKGQALEVFNQYTGCSLTTI